jgi:uncharacterized membrane protein
VSGANVAEAGLGLLLVFFVPGYAVTKALFPEWRIRGRVAGLRLVEITTLAFVTSVALTVLVGYGLLAGAPGGFQASWSDPVLEAILVAIAGLAALVGFLRGAYARVPPAPTATEPDGGEEGAWEVSREIDRLDRQLRRLRHDLRTGSGNPNESARLQGEVERLQAERDALCEQREAQYLV